MAVPDKPDNKRDKQSLVAGLVASHGQQLRRFLTSRVRNLQDVPDIIQEVYLRMLRVPNHESIRSPEAYLFTVALHVAQQHTLRAAATPPSVELSKMLSELRSTTVVDPALELDAERSLEELQRALEELSPKAQATFLMHARDGLTLEKIGEHLGVSRPMAKKYLKRALLHFRQALEDE